ncbi:MAG: two-component system NtrC family sensor histidine kinase PilS, partial [bacterium]
LRQIVWNLARNALQAMPEGGKLIIGIRETKKQEIEIIFSDTGVGMSEQEMERIFEPFNSNHPGGTGLGMAIVYQIVSDHSGKITVESSPQQGTKITITIPQNKNSLIDSAIDILKPVKIFSTSGKITSKGEI